MARFVVLKRGGVAGKVGVNPDLVTDVRSAAGAFTDIFFGEHQITVEGTFEQVVSLLSGDLCRPDHGPEKHWLKKAG